MTAESTAVGPAAVALWRDGNFTRFWTGQALGQFGAQLGQLAFAEANSKLESTTQLARIGPPPTEAAHWCCW